MFVAVADTHAVIWYLSADKRLSTHAKQVLDEASINGNTIAISSITFIEMAYLVEKGRISANNFTELALAVQNNDSIFIEIPITLEIARVLTRVDAAQIPDMPDRIIAATALHLNTPIISRDGKIQASNLETIW